MFFILNFLFNFALAKSMRNEINLVFISFYVDTIRFNQNEKKNHFAMLDGILNFISFCVDSMRSVLNEKLFVLICLC